MSYTIVRDGKSEEYHLCADCAAEKGLAGHLGAAISSLGYLLDDLFREASNQEGTENDVSCPGCHLDLARFRQRGRLGCDRCYQAFAPMLRRMIRQIHGSGRHLGKIKIDRPRPEAGSRGDDLQSLKSQMAEAIGREDFELAAALRDRIRILEAKGNEPAS